MKTLNVLVIDDELALRHILAKAIEKAGHVVDTAGSGTEALEKLSSGEFDVAVSDIRMPDITGIEVVDRAREKGIETCFLMMTAFASVNTAIEAMRAGAYDYMVKPVRNEDVINRLSQIADILELRSENKVLRNLVMATNENQCRMVSEAMARTDRLVKKVAVTDSTVIITGESGTGKGVTARSIHENSLRANAPFIPVNCGAIPENLLESEFFGHAKGAFTGAHKAKKGLFVEADQGTIFLDEIGELPLNLQVKLLHVIEDNSVRPVGSEQARQVDVRIIAATNRDLEKMVAEGTFREDLYFRLNIFNIEIPPLRERLADIPILTEFFIKRESKKLGLGEQIDIEPEALELLKHYSYQGNVRELENIIARSLILAEDNLIRVTDLPTQVIKSGGTAPINGEMLLRDQVRQFEIRVIKQAIDEAGGDRRIAAKKLGLGLSSLYRKLEGADE
ncbi:sigma-54-dependent transcriptional regulator [Aestuariirhabdus litorea]|uniref:Sigma-54-dependent Fis family transcriptional regulator n=1 Tax=Aestuariirhabdus litorea TaxID=2528527 RepID=A0A3P3VSH5_9GAMM|nr:sigma-54 dependent transcriptional regulator [Aestuariirhabdus litorea]RRJ85267.1 sigma-54-dependent Fis family transcriptional regulator [Aestuariirhabdus litorea]RWW98489.1 response regulator [Endozoicomonadaceae bacterium GTF-13]